MTEHCKRASFDSKFAILKLHNSSCSIAFSPRLRPTLATVHPGLSREHTAPVAFLVEEAVGDDGEPATATQVSFLRFTRVAA